MILNALVLALREIRRNLMRSFLTSLGIIIGVAAVITMVTLGNGATEKVKSQIASLGSNLLQLRAGQGFHGPGGVRATAPPFNLSDIEAISREVSGVEAVAPIAGLATQAIFGNRNWFTTITGSTNDFMAARDWPVAKGRVFTVGELRAGKAVCILGTTVAREVFGAEEPSGATIRLKKLAFKVIGVFSSKGESPFGTDRDNFILIPMRTFQRRIAGNTDVSRVYISVLDGFSIDGVNENIARLVRERRHIRVGENDDFYIRDMREITEVLSGTTRVLTSLLGAIAAVSLLVGGIGIMNILLQFLVEAVVLSSMGGGIGIILALVVSAGLAKLLLVPLVLKPGIIVVAFLFSAAIGVFFGYFPARNAARLDPIEALRHE